MALVSTRWVVTIMKVEEQEVLVPIEGLTIKFSEGRFAKFNSIQCFTEPNCRVKVSNADLKQFTLKVFHYPRPRPLAPISPMDYADAESCLLPKPELRLLDPVPVEATVLYRIAGE